MQSDAPKPIDLQKKMKRMCMTLIMIFVGMALLHCQNKKLMAGIDFTALAGGKATLSIEYGFACHWSAGGEASYGFGCLWKGMDDLESSHKLEFSDMIHTPSPDNLHKESIYAKYWPTHLMKGCYLLTAISHGSTTGTDLIIGAGYLLHIWKCINAYTEYRYTISETDTPVTRLSAGICLTFGN